MQFYLDPNTEKRLRKMLLLRGICLLAFITSALCQQPSNEDTKNSKPLQIKEIRQVMRQGDLSGENHSIKVVISIHEPLYNVTQWELWLMKNDEDTVKYFTEGDGSNPTSQTEFIFEGNLVDADSIMIMAKNQSTAVAVNLLSVKIRDLHTDVAWVGDFHDGPASSLRVRPGNVVGDVQVNSVMCKANQSHCYYIEVKPKPAAIERCYMPIPQLKQCDDRIRTFKAPSSTPAVTLHNNTTLKVEVDSNGEGQNLEVIAYDSLDSNNIYSEYPYNNCYMKVGNEQEEDGKYQCYQKINLPEGKTEFNVLIVKLDNNGQVIESSLQVYGGEPPLPPRGFNTGVIVGAILGTIFGLFILVLLVKLFLRHKERQNPKTNRGATAVYSPTTTTEPVNTETA